MTRTKPFRPQSPHTKHNPIIEHTWNTLLFSAMNKQTALGLTSQTNAKATKGQVSDCGKRRQNTAQARSSFHMSEWAVNDRLANKTSSLLFLRSMRRLSFSTRGPKKRAESVGLGKKKGHAPREFTRMAGTFSSGTIKKLFFYLCFTLKLNRKTSIFGLRQGISFIVLCSIFGPLRMPTIPSLCDHFAAK